MIETNAWQQILAYLKPQINIQAYQTWLQPTSLLPGSNGKLIVRVPCVEFEDWIQEKYHDAIADAIRILKLPIQDIEYKPDHEPIPEIPPDEDEKAVEGDGARHVNLCPTVPEAAWYGMAKQYREIVSPCCEASDNYHLACFLACCATGLAKNVFVNRSGHNFPNLFIVLVGDSCWSAKSTAMKYADELLHSENSSVITLTSIDSAEGTLDVMDEEIRANDEKRHGSVLIRLDELNAMLIKANRRGSGIVPDLKQAFDCLKTNLQLNTRSRRISIKNPPPFTLLAGSETDDLSDMDQRNVKGGLGNRIIFIAGTPKEPNSHDSWPDQNPRWLELKENLWKTFKFWQERGQTEIKLSPKAILLWDEFYKTIRQRGSDDELVVKLAARHRAYVPKIALIFAALDRSDMIHAEHLNAAITFMNFCLESLYFLFRSSGMDKWAKLSQRIVDFVMRSGGKARFRDANHLLKRENDWVREMVFERLIATEKQPCRRLRSQEVLDATSERYSRWLFLNKF